MLVITISETKNFFFSLVDLTLGVDDTRFANYDRHHRGVLHQISAVWLDVALRPEVRKALEQSLDDQKDVAERLSVFGSDPITVDQLPSSSRIVRIGDEGPVMPLREFKAQSEKEYIEAVLRRTNWNVSKAAQPLDIQRTYLHEKMTALGIRKP